MPIGIRSIQNISIIAPIIKPAYGLFKISPIIGAMIIGREIMA